MPIPTKEQEERVQQEVFDSAFANALRERDDEGEDNKTPDVSSVYSQYVSGLGTMLRDLFEQAERDRVGDEDQWIKSLRQYKAQYDPEIEARMHPKRSKAYMSITRTKVNTVDARMLDILFPANEGRNWGINPTPVPELDPELEQDVVEQITQIMGKEPSQDELKSILHDEAKRRCNLMEKEMEDQLTDLRYRDIIRRVIHSGNLFGTGVLKGPLVQQKEAKRWVKAPDDWATISIKSIAPYCEFVPIWDLYPDMTATEPDNLRYIFQRNVMPKHKLYALSKRDDFKSEAIESYMEAYPQGDASYKNFETNLRHMGSANTVDFAKILPREDKYEVVEFWGYLSSDDLINAGVDVDEDAVGKEVIANVWMLGPVIIKAVISPIEGASLPYFFYYFEKDETNIFGEGIPVIMRDAQHLFNASIRALLDNAAISAGPIIEINIDLLDPQDDPTDIYPFRVFQRRGSGQEASYKAVHVTDLPSYTKELLALAEFFMSLADEVTVIPRYMHGEQNNVRGAGQTATGLSMLMGAVNITLKDLVKNFDDGITKPFIRALYFWNMDFNKKDDIKGDFSVVAKGSSSLIAKEVRSEQLLAFLNVTNNDVDLMYIQRPVALREILKAYDLDDLELIKSDHQIRIEQQQRNEAAEQEKQFIQAIEWMKAQSGGHMSQPAQAEEEGVAV